MGVYRQHFSIFLKLANILITPPSLSLSLSIYIYKYCMFIFLSVRTSLSSYQFVVI